MLKVVKRKALAGVITLVIAILTYGFILFNNNNLITYGLIPLYSVAIFCGGILSLGIDYILRSTNYRFILSLILHILVVLLLQRIFWTTIFGNLF